MFVAHVTLAVPKRRRDRPGRAPAARLGLNMAGAGGAWCGWLAVLLQGDAAGSGFGLVYVVEQAHLFPPATSQNSSGLSQK